MIWSRIFTSYMQQYALTHSFMRHLTDVIGGKAYDLEPDFYVIEAPDANGKATCQLGIQVGYVYSCFLFIFRSFLSFPSCVGIITLASVNHITFYSKHSRFIQSRSDGTVTFITGTVTIITCLCYQTELFIPFLP
jgi:hypothetical protein